MKKFLILLSLVVMCFTITSCRIFKVNLVESKEYSALIDGINWKFKRYGNGVEICKTDVSGCVNIPSQLYGYPVLSIGDNAFSYCSGLTSIVISASVTNIGEDAFMCSGITTIKIPQNVSSIKGNPFVGCWRLMKLRVAKDNMNYTAKDDILYSKNMTKFICCPEMKYFFSFLPSVTIIGEKAFYMCRNLDKITIPDCVTEIGDNAFANSWIKSVDILSNNVKINGNIFADAVHLKEIKVAENNINYVVKDGVLYSKDMSKIICAEKNIETCSVPNGVIEICPYAFDKCYKLTNIEIPSTVTVIDDYAFRNCIRLTNIVIPNSVTKIGEKAFFRCRRLEEIDIPNSVNTIGNNAFDFCNRLKLVKLPRKLSNNRHRYGFYGINMEIILKD